LFQHWLIPSDTDSLIAYHKDEVLSPEIDGCTEKRIDHRAHDRWRTDTFLFRASAMVPRANATPAKSPNLEIPSQLPLHTHPASTSLSGSIDYDHMAIIAAERLASGASQYLEFAPPSVHPVHSILYNIPASKLYSARP